MTSFYDLPPPERLAHIRANRESNEQALAQVLPQLEAANERLEAAQRDYDAVLAAYAANMRAREGPSHAYGETWSTGDVDRKRAAADRDREDITRAYEEAREAHQAALTARNQLDWRRSEHRQQIRLCEQLTAQTEAELEREQAEETRQRGALDRIRARIAG